MVRLEVFSDYVCPFCWLAEPALGSLKREAPEVEIIRRAYELRPEPVPTLDPQGEYLRRVWRDAVYPMAERMGIEITLPPVQPRSRRAHEAARWAREQGRFEDYHDAVFRAFFQRGEDIGKEEVLTYIASELNLDGESLGRALAARAYETGVLADERAAEAMQIKGVPAFVAERLVMLSGVQPVNKLKELVDDVREIAPSRKSAS
jgi:predicted DsbA family dithiol-disulfide isomerase